MRSQVLLAVAALGLLTMGATAIPDLGAHICTSADPPVCVSLDRFQPVVIAPSKICGLGAPPMALPELPVGTLFAADFDAASPGSINTVGSTNYWHVTTFAGQGIDQGHSGPGRLYYGVERPQGGSFNFGRTYGAVTFTQPLVIPTAGETIITWNEKWEVEWGGFGIYDAMGVQLVDSATTGFLQVGGSAGNPLGQRTLCLSDPIDPVPQSADPGTGIPSCSPDIFSPCATPPAWGLRHEFVDDQYKGRTVYLRFAFDAMDSLYNDFLGWMIDDVNVITIGG